jgi:hypothetical protein
MPVTLRSGRARLASSPSPTASAIPRSRDQSDRPQTLQTLTVKLKMAKNVPLALLAGADEVID